MNIEKLLAFIKWLFSRAGLAYILIAVVALSFVDTKVIASRIKVRRLNDARPAMNQLVSFAKGETDPSGVNWAPYLKYYSLVFKYMPGEEVGKMFLAGCQYYTGDQEKTAWGLMRSSAEAYPFVFWNLYNAGVMAFAQGDMVLSVRYLERALFFPPEKVADVMRSSVVYRQVMAADNFNVQVAGRVNEAREDAYLLLAAAYYYMKDYEKAKVVALSVFDKMTVRDPEPFYFYAGVSSLALGKTTEAFSLISKCVELRSHNPLVYRYAAEMLKASGRADLATNVFKAGEGLLSRQPSGFPYPDRLRPRFF